MLMLGIDEVGRGSIAGPIVVGAVVLHKDIEGLKDSKLLSFKKRLYYDSVIRAEAKYIGLGWVEPSELDAIGLSRSLELASERALEGLNFKVELTIIDGTVNFLHGRLNSTAIIKADNLVNSVSAASIVAKVARDNYMIGLAKDYPNYWFDKNVGYCTKQHLAAVIANGACIQHRLSFEPIKSLVKDRKIALV